ncbi:MAG: hypothetical protein K2V38_11220, partial [Gemmataceae bacterium]|nr:hypothetical protein [Gemmataceae bacterium]
TPRRAAVRLGNRMTWKGQTPTVDHLAGEYRDGGRLTKAQMKTIEARLERSKTLTKYDITIRPRKTTGG